MVFCNCSRYMNPPAKKSEAYRPTKEEQMANSITHGIFVVPAIIFMYKMCAVSSSRMHMLIALVYGFALVLLFGISTLFHVISLTDQCTRLRGLLHLGDKFIIYIFIAASYMPWLLLQDFGVSVEYLIWTIWIAAFSGIFYSVLFYEKYKMLETCLYMCLGILPSLPLIQYASQGLYELAGGGLLYISGVIFFKSDGRIPFAHAIWHLFVAGGAILHLVATWNILFAV